jgi:hypothetical protein
MEPDSHSLAATAEGGGGRGGGDSSYRVQPEGEGGEG